MIEDNRLKLSLKANFLHSCLCRSVTNSIDAAPEIAFADFRCAVPKLRSGMGISVNTRELILDLLMEITVQREYSHKVIGQALDKYNYMENREKAFVKRVTEGTVERMLQIDYVLDRFSKVPAVKMKPVIRNLLRMGVYQILFMDTVPDSAVCNEAVKLAEKRKFGALKGFVNGVLRNIARNRKNIPWPDEEKDFLQYVSVMYSMPEWIVSMWAQQYGEDKAKSLCAALLEVRPVTIRLEEGLEEAEKEALLSRLRDEVQCVESHPYLPYAYYLKGVDGVSALPGFSEGKFTVQDVSSMLVAEAAGIEKGLSILDVCAAPGGKALHCASKLSGTGMVEARDISQYKTALIEENIRRMRKDNIKAKVSDALVFDSSSEETADILLADVPCSGLGVLGKKRDIKYRADRESIKQVNALQKSILDTVWRYVKKGGVLIYSTCTICRDENEKMVEYLTDRYPFAAESLDPCLPPALRSEATGRGMLQLLPGVHETDGFFIARLRRLEE